ncbi:kinesin-like protein KIF24 [Discoglossus pictus]
MKMASCLFDCLREADLEKYYPQFLSLGLHKIEELAKITMRDYTTLGVNNMEDRKRLFQLIKIVQSVAEDTSDKTPLQPGCVYPQPMKNRSGPRRQLQFDISLERDHNIFAPSELSDFSHNYAMKHPGELFDVALDDQRYGRTILLAGLDTDAACTAKGQFSLKGTDNNQSDNEVPPIHRVNHLSGYNYGVPQNCLRPNISEREGSQMETEKIRVCVRKRPLSLREERRGELNVVTVEDKETLLIYEKKEAVNLKEYILQHVFYFDEVFSEACTNQDVYLKTAHPLIQHVFNGGNATCFAYGQTGAGKTYTMIGTSKNPGLYALAAKDIFQQLESVQSKKDYLVLISFYEIYCGQLYDLLNGRKRLFAREDGNRVVQIVGLREVQVSSVDLLLEMILKGSRERSTGATGVNSDSSRSHAVIQIQIKDSVNRKLGRISFVDLAGSERASDARDSDKQTKIEGAEINQSLLALKECIRALDQEQAHTPFRQSKLTQVLKDSFIGNSKTCMIANVSPSHIATEHTLNTLRYADRVKELKKGMKCSPFTSNRVRTTTSVSPKRMQNSPSVLGDKISPKKVKLGLQNNSTSNPAKPKTCPTIFHPANIPFSSTPKICSKTSSGKGSLSHAWLNHTTPVKGVIKSGNNRKKKSEDQLLQDKKCVLKNPSTKTAEMRENHAQNNRPAVSQRIQAVQPVQKQIVPRSGLLLGAQNYHLPSDCNQDPLNKKLETEVLTSNFPLQKEREQHLRCYHQQFQHPPILQQKLQYQPLENILNQYNPEEICVENSSSPKPPSVPQYEERVQLEDLDDSDFSEDSFSYVSSHKEERNKETIGERLSFFLHQKSPTAETTKSLEREQNVNSAESHNCNQSVNCCLNGSGLTKSRDQVDNVGHTENNSFWSSKDSSSVHDSSKTSNTPEKPYSSQESLSPFQNKKYVFPTRSTEKEKSAHHSTLSKLQEKCSRLVYMIDASANHTDKTKINMQVKNGEQHYEEAVSTSSDSVSGLMAPLSVSLLKDNWSVESQEFSVGPENQAGNDILNEAWTQDAKQDSSKDKSSERSVGKFVKQILKYNEMLNLPNSKHGEKNWFSQLCNDSDCYLMQSPPVLIKQDDKCSPRKENFGLSGGSMSTECLNNRDASFDFAITPYDDNHTSPYYDADTEETTIGMKFGKIPQKSEEMKPSRSFENTSKQEQKRFSNDLLLDISRNISNVHSNCNSHFHQHEHNVGDLEGRCLEDSFTLSFNSNELECLKSKLIKYIFAQRNDKEEPLSRSDHTVMQKSPKNVLSVGSQTHDLATSGVQANIKTARHLVVQAHREQLKEITALCTKEELLLNQLPNSDFMEYVTKLDEILVLQSKSIQSMRAQLKLFLAYPQKGDPGNCTANRVTKNTEDI